jgi:Putative transposase
MMLATGEFIRRFMLHVLPKGFHGIRHYVLLASAGAARTGVEACTAPPLEKDRAGRIPDASARWATCPGDGVTRSARRWYGECMMHSVACRDAKHRKDLRCSLCPMRRD